MSLFILYLRLARFFFGDIILFLNMPFSCFACLPENPKDARSGESKRSDAVTSLKSTVQTTVQTTRVAQGPKLNHKKGVKGAGGLIAAWTKMIICCISFVIVETILRQA